MATRKVLAPLDLAHSENLRRSNLTSLARSLARSRRPVTRALAPGAPRLLPASPQPSSCDSPEFLNPKLLQLLPKLANLLLGSIVLISRSISPRTSSFVASSSAVGRSGSTKLKSEVERSVRYWRYGRDWAAPCGCDGRAGTVYDGFMAVVGNRNTGTSLPLRTDFFRCKMPSPGATNSATRKRGPSAVAYEVY